MLNQFLASLGFEVPTGTATDSLCLRWTLAFLPVLERVLRASGGSMLYSMSPDGSLERPRAN